MFLLSCHIFFKIECCRGFLSYKGFLSYGSFCPGCWCLGGICLDEGGVKDVLYTYVSGDVNVWMALIYNLSKHLMIIMFNVQSFFFCITTEL